MIDFFSPRKQVSKNTPPTFLVHANDDQAVPVQNSLGYYESLINQGVSTSLHLFPTGGHGFAMAKDQGLLSRWKDILLAWIKEL
jgi:dipeptidyl aminopeptidase/acylaminoacyl peptidase